MKGPRNYRHHGEDPAPLSDVDFVEICASVDAQCLEYLRRDTNESYIEHQQDNGFCVSHNGLKFRVSDGIVGSFAGTCVSPLAFLA